MAGHPSAAELATVVAEFLGGLIERGALTGRDAFHARVAANALAIVAREVAGGGAAVGEAEAALVPYCHPGAGRDPGSQAAVIMGPGLRRDDREGEEASAVATAALRASRLPRESGDPSPETAPAATTIGQGIKAQEMGSRFRGDDSEEEHAADIEEHAEGNKGPRGAVCDEQRGEDKGVAVAATLSAAIRAGTVTAATPGLLDALIAATCARLRVDNPRYPTLARLCSGEHDAAMNGCTGRPSG